MSTATPYSALAAGYDVVMAHVEYDLWAEYVVELFERHAPRVRSILELGAGTGSLAYELQPMGRYRYVATDNAEPMLAVGRRKGDLFPEADVTFAYADFRTLDRDLADLGGPFDAVLLLYDGVNYLLEPAEIAKLLADLAPHLAPGGVFILDQSTPANSINNAAYFEDEGEAEGFAYVRRSHYDPATRLHTNAFTLTVLGRRFQEEHVQRAYDQAELDAVIAASPLEVVAAYDDFSFDPATDASERIHWVLSRA